LLGGQEFRSWLETRGAPRRSGPAHRVRVERDGDELHVLLDRPQRRNAVDAAMRQSLLEALSIAAFDPAVRVVIRGSGPSFCAGGDLDEFGTARDLAAAHVTRTVASVGAAIARIADRVTVRVHGVCAGAGIELAAFAATVVSAAGSEFVLPEIGLGLIPGAGGTVSLTRRIGRQRTLWMALTAARVSASVALEWGLVDAVE
jgi:enoyl-CoA hydratase/carnithine racemase